MILDIQRGDSVPLYRQIVNQLRLFIEQGRLSPGARLPTVRQLASDHGLTRLTVQNAFAELQDQGWIESMVGRGTFVSSRPRPLLAAFPEPARMELDSSLAELLHPAEDPGQFWLGQAAPSPETYPLKDLKSSLWAALQHPESLGYGPIQGEECLRTQVSRLLLQRGLAVSAEQILITAGAQQAIDLSIRALANSRPVALEVPVYTGVLESLRGRALPIVEVPIEAQGSSLAALEEACRKHRPGLLYAVPSFHNPTGLVAQPERRRALLELAERYDFLILEDDVYGFLAFDAPAPAPLKASDRNDRVIYLTSFSKTVAPGLRLGAVVASAAHLTALSEIKQATDLICSSLLQRGMAEFLRRGCFEAHIQRVIRLYRERRDAMVEAFGDSSNPACAACLWTVPAGGLSAWLELPPLVDEADFFRDAKQRGLLLARGQAFFSTRRSQGYFRLSFGNAKPKALQQAVRILGELLSEHQSRQASLQAKVRLKAGPLV